MDIDFNANYEVNFAQFFIFGSLRSIVKKFHKEQFLLQIHTLKSNKGTSILVFQAFTHSKLNTMVLLAIRL